MGALTAKQVESLEAVRAHRGEVAHELARLLVDPDADVDVNMLAQLRGIMHSLDRFWGAIEVDINPDSTATGTRSTWTASGPGQGSSSITCATSRGLSDVGKRVSLSGGDVTHLEEVTTAAQRA